MAITNIEQGLALFPVGNLLHRLIDIDGLASYTTGGQAITAASLGFKRILFVASMTAADASNFTQALIAAKKGASSFKLMWFVATTGAEVANAVNLSTKSAKLYIVGV